MRPAILLLAAALALTAGGAARAQSRGPTLDIRDAVARIIVVPEARSDIKVEVVSANRALPLQVRGGRDRVIIDGHLGHRIRGCGEQGVSVRVSGLGELSEAQIPQLLVRTPRNVKVASGGAVFGAVGRAASVDLGNAGCGDWTLANVEGLLQVQEAGSGDLRSGSAGEAKLRVAGSGNLTIGPVRGPLEIDVGGSGNVTVASVAGPLDVKIAGSGDVKVLGGQAPTMVAAVAGSGGIMFSGVAGSLKARVAGSGDIGVDRVVGPVTRSILGGGQVKIGGVSAARRP